MSKLNFLYVNIVFLLIVWVCGFYQGIITAVDVWAVSEIYNHCFFILPVVGLFIFKKRGLLLSHRYEPNYWLLAPFLLTLFIQLFAQVGDIKVLMHLATFTALPLMFWMLFGNKISKEVAFPLFFILFCVPIGDQLIPTLQVLTTDLAVPMLEFTKVPVYRSGLYLEIPEGRFLVAEACSGISFLITSIAFGFLYSYASFDSIAKRAAFISISFIVPILANAIRVYGIVLTGHLSDMEYAVGADHLIYGGVFYGIVLFILIFIGENFRDKKAVKKVDSTSFCNEKETSSMLVLARPISILFVFIIALQVWQYNINSVSNSKSYERIVAKETSLRFNEEPLTAWYPKLHNTTLHIEGLVLNNGQQFGLFAAFFDSINGELISSQHRFYDDKQWTLESKKTITFDNLPFEYYQVISQNDIKRELIVWYVINNKQFSSKAKAKLYQAYLSMLGNDATGKIYLLSTEQMINKIKDKTIYSHKLLREYKKELEALLIVSESTH